MPPTSDASNTFFHIVFQYMVTLYDGTVQEANETLNDEKIIFTPIQFSYNFGVILHRYS
jgi:hypothetical protein